MTQIQLYLDEDVWQGLAITLREAGFDVIHVYDVGRGGLSDEAQLAYAATEGWAILTHNSKDFVPLAVAYYFDGEEHAGIIVSEQVEKGELVRRTKKLLTILSTEEVKGTLRYLADYK